MQVNARLGLTIKSSVLINPTPPPISSFYKHSMKRVYKKSKPKPVCTRMIGDYIDKPEAKSQSKA